MPRITKSSVENLKTDVKPRFLWDDEIKGFGVKVTPTGKRTYIFKYRPKGGGRRSQQRWYTIGTHGHLKPGEARDLAKRVGAAVADGKDPQADKFAVREAPTLQELWDKYTVDHLPNRATSTQRNAEQLWRLYIKQSLGKRRVSDVTRQDIDRLHRKMRATPYQANRTIALLSKMFNLAERWAMRPDGSNPCRNVDRYKEEARERYLSAGELRRLGKALDDGLAAQLETPHMVAAIKLLLLTGARVSEILGLKWEDIDRERATAKLASSKTGKRYIYLSEPALTILNDLVNLPVANVNPFVIAGRYDHAPLDNLRKPWRRICKRASLTDVRLHDLRHTAASIGVAHGLSLPIIGRILGHTQAQTTQRYAHVAVDPALDAVNQIGMYINEQFSDQDDK